jgi:hypothetical protein
MQGARVFGVIDGTPTEPLVAYLKKSAVVDSAILKTLDGLDPKQVFRFAGKCEEHRCVHFEGAKCTLVQRIVASLDPVVDVAPPCQIRPTCRWHAERGVEACRRCPQIVTMIPRAKSPLNQVASSSSIIAR